MRESRRAAAAAAVVLGLAALLAGCGRTTLSAADAAHTAAARKTPPPDVQTCADITGFEHATSLPIADLPVPATAVAYFSLHPWSVDSYALYEYHVCLPTTTKGEDAGDATVSSLFSASGSWQAAQQFPADGKQLSSCVAPATGAAATPTSTPAATPEAPGSTASRCWTQPGGSYIRVDSVAQEGRLVWFRLMLAKPPILAKPAGPSTTQTCDPAVYISYPGLQSIIITDGMQIPIPEGTARGESVWGYQASGKGYNMPYIVTGMCTTVGGSILDFMKQTMPSYGWFQGGDDGLHWRIANPGGTVLYLTFAGLDTPAHWDIVLNYIQDGPPPVMPTPVPDGPNASCSSVSGLENAQPITIPGAQFPAGFVAAGTIKATGTYTVMDFLACAPDFELTAKPENGSGGSPLYAMFMEGNWGYTSAFPRDGTNVSSCDTSAAGNYLKQWCSTQGGARYVEIERVSEPGKGLVVFHLLYAYRP